MMPQFQKIKNKVINYENIAKGLFIFSIGLFKKVVIADSFASVAISGFDRANTLDMIEGWVTSLSYTFQLYFDFSGYTDMAIGSALLFNIRLPINFNSPYKALDIQDFWRRWHITLSRFLRDYIYIPLGGNRVRELRVYINIFIVFLIGGLWHGAGWTFIVWGVLHGLACVVYRCWKSLGFSLPNIIAWIITFNFINITWVFFRANSFADAFKVIKAMFSFDIVLPLINSLEFLEKYGIRRDAWLRQVGGDKYTIVLIILVFILILFFKNSIYLKDKLKLNSIYAFLTALIFAFSLNAMNKLSEFLYFNF